MLPSSERGVLNALHILRHDPSRVLAEVESKREILRKCESIFDGSAWDLAQETLILLARPYLDQESRP